MHIYIYTHIYIITLNKFSCGQLLNNWIKKTVHISKCHNIKKRVTSPSQVSLPPCKPSLSVVRPVLIEERSFTGHIHNHTEYNMQGTLSCPSCGQAADAAVPFQGLVFTFLDTGRESNLLRLLQRCVVLPLHYAADVWIGDSGTKKKTGGAD